MKLLGVLLLVTLLSSCVPAFGRIKAAYVACEGHGGVDVRDDRWGTVICRDESMVQYAPPDPHSKATNPDERAIQGATRIKRST